MLRVFGDGAWRWSDRRGRGGRREEPGMGVRDGCIVTLVGMWLELPVRGWLSPENSKQTKVPSIDHQTRGLSSKPVFPPPPHKRGEDEHGVCTDGLDLGFGPM